MFNHIQNFFFTFKHIYIEKIDYVGDFFYVQIRIIRKIFDKNMFVESIKKFFLACYEYDLYSKIAIFFKFLAVFLNLPFFLIETMEHNQNWFPMKKKPY